MPAYVTFGILKGIFLSGAGEDQVIIMSEYGLDDRAIEVRSPAKEKAFVSRPALGPTQPPVQWVPEVLSPGVKGGRGVTLTTHLPIAEVVNE
jgi:hypothetical protein